MKRKPLELAIAVALAAVAAGVQAQAPAPAAKPTIPQVCLSCHKAQPSAVQGIFENVAFKSQAIQLKIDAHTEIVRSDPKPAKAVDGGVAQPAEALHQWLVLQPGVSIKETIRDGLRIAIEGGTPDMLSQILKRMIGEGFPIYEFVEHKRRLEDAFVEMVSRPKDKKNKTDKGRTEN